MPPQLALHSRPSAVLAELQIPLPPKLQRWIVVIGGFTQSRYSSGLAGVWLRLLRRHQCTGTRVTSHPWNDDWRGLAEMVHRCLLYTADPAPVDIVAYSWGVAGGMEFARQLKALGFRVRVIVSCDGVCRPWLARWRALWSPLLSPLIGEPVIDVPANVERVVYLRQRTNLPRGHEFRGEQDTLLEDRGLLRKGWTHQDADNSQEFHSLAMEICG